MEARRRDLTRRLLALDGEYEPGKLGEARGFLAALEWLRELPEKLAELEAEERERALPQEPISPAQARAESLAEG